MITEQLCSVHPGYKGQDLKKMYGFYNINKCCVPVVKLLVGILLLMPQGLSLVCPSVCQRCSRTLVQCCNLGFTSVPRNFAKTTSVIYLSRNNISNVTPEDLEGFNRLSSLFLDNSGLVDIHPQAFISLTNLYYLYLNNNQIQYIKQGIFGSLSKLRYLYLQHNHILSIPRRLFSDLTALRYLQLEGNSLRVLSNGMFIGLMSLHTLHLANNRISWVSNSSFNQLARLEFLNLQSNYLTWIPSNTFIQLKILKSLILSNNPIKLIHTNSFNGLGSLKYLYLGNSKIKSIAKDGFTAMKSLIHLTLSNNSIIRINSDAFKILHLGYLRLDHNNISFIEPDAFEGMATTLKILHLANNRLANLLPEVLRPLVSLNRLVINDNPWECNCNLLSLHRWLLSSSLRLNIRCHSPSQLRGKSLHYVSVNEVSGCNNSLVSLGLDIEKRSPTTSRLLTSIKTDTSNVHFKSERSSVTVQDFRDAVFVTEGTQQYTSMLPGQLSVANESVNLTTFAASDMASISIKPLFICEQNLEKLNQAFDILLVFFILACAAVLFLIYKVQQLHKKLKDTEAEGDNVLEYYGVYPYARYYVTDSVQVIPPEPVTNPDVDQTSILKIADPTEQAEVILFEHSVL
ncbi:leucine-rich repeat-containing protein 70-like isoform X1 [Chiloscyllium plagiosum]|uniref:leucine-rich repeat-containing protein 70-like isoform X1 n=2 Tax=Chiloscyllium plagiosum TaxID=36176 RepID=UPI001CB874C5|nr:leucine-rich repeat-containing protein 70-like isoform X1 [Chiloscyllium plagiosum]